MVGKPLRENRFLVMGSRHGGDRYGGTQWNLTAFPVRVPDDNKLGLSTGGRRSEDPSMVSEGNTSTEK
ncbi:hypothetical protein RUM44_010028 [Polyplax serrata]|uniref:Uncharacterized protein n=1 Tax=Polyplax serrata TaxID=468196 RepID=A0ABR1AUF0_POLSC